VPQGFVLEHCLGQDALCKNQTNKQTLNIGAGLMVSVLAAETLAFSILV
jgi:hypothetical protein